MCCSYIVGSVVFPLQCGNHQGTHPKRKLTLPLLAAINCPFISLTAHPRNTSYVLATWSEAQCRHVCMLCFLELGNGSEVLDTHMHDKRDIKQAYTRVVVVK